MLITPLSARETALKGNSETRWININTLQGRNWTEGYKWGTRSERQIGLGSGDNAQQPEMSAPRPGGKNDFPEPNHCPLLSWGPWSLPPRVQVKPGQHESRSMASAFSPVNPNYFQAARSHRRSGFDPWVRNIPWRRKCNPLQHSCLENPMERGAWLAIVQSVANSQTRLNDRISHTKW